METMVSTSNNIEQETFLWQKLIWSNQPGALLSTVLFIEMSIAILFIMTLLKEKEKEKEEKYYYNNLSNSCLTILLVIISGIIFGKGVEIFFRTLHICSGAYGNVGFSLNDIFMSLSFGCIFVISGYFLLFNKKLYKLLRLLSVDADKGPATVDGLQKRLAKLKQVEIAKLEEMMASAKATMANDKALIVDKLIAMLDYLELTMVGKPKETRTKLKNVWIKINKTLPKLYEIGFEIKDTWNSLNEMEPGMNPYVKAELEEKDKTDGKLTSDLSEKLISYELNEAGPEEIEAELQAIEAGLDKIVAGFKEYKEILTKEKAAKESELKATMANDETLIVDRLIAMLDYLELTMVGKPEETVPKLKNVWIKINKTLPKLNEIGFEIEDTWDSLNEMEPGMNPDVKAELEEKDKNNVKLTSDLSEKLISYELNEAGPEEIEAELQAIEAGLDKIEAGFQEYKEILTKERARLTQVPTN
ncbi:hypothetical protein GINT2_000233 [Glugoides intestinalis]